jgi:hypothetical protein
MSAHPYTPAVDLIEKALAAAREASREADSLREKAAKWDKLSPTARRLIEDVQDMLVDRETNTTTLEEDVIKTINTIEAVFLAELHANTRKR